MMKLSAFGRNTPSFDGGNCQMVILILPLVRAKKSLNSNFPLNARLYIMKRIDPKPQVFVRKTHAKRQRSAKIVTKYLEMNSMKKSLYHF